MQALANMDARIWQAVIAGAFLAAGWIVNGWQNRRADERFRAEKLRDLHRALYAEIGTNLANLSVYMDMHDYVEGLEDRMRRDPDFIPFIPREHHDFVFDTVVPEIYLLPRQTIDRVVEYYTQIKTISAFADDMRGEGFKALSQDRRIAMYLDYLLMKRQALEFGNSALGAILAYQDGKGLSPSNPASALSGQPRE
jgi:hypothetical protein